VPCVTQRGQPQPDESAELLAQAWERHRTQLFEGARPVSDWLIDQIDPRPGQTILELAAGPGETGFLAAERIGADGRLISSDISSGMVDAARGGPRPVVSATSSSVSWTPRPSSCRTRASTPCSHDSG